MFEYQMTRYAEEHTQKLWREAVNARLARAATPRLAQKAARTLRGWANRLDRGTANASGAMPWAAGGWAFEQLRPERQHGVAGERNRRYAGTRL